jgi:hypothetical protein
VFNYKEKEGRIYALMQQKSHSFGVAFSEKHNHQFLITHPLAIVSVAQ